MPPGEALEPRVPSAVLEEAMKEIGQEGQEEAEAEAEDLAHGEEEAEEEGKGQPAGEEEGHAEPEVGRVGCLLPAMPPLAAAAVSADAASIRLCASARHQCKARPQQHAPTSAALAASTVMPAAACPPPAAALPAA